MKFHARPASSADVPAVVQLWAESDRHWFGEPENDESEVRESFDRVEPLAERSRVLHLDNQLVAAAWWWQPEETTMIVAPGSDGAPIYADLLPWFEQSGATKVECLDRDRELLAALTQHGWQHYRSQFELMRDTSELPPPSWPEGITARSAEDDAEAIYHVIYDDAGWADVPGHPWRPFDEWRSIFLNDDADLGQQVVAEQQGRIVGAALSRTFSDGMGWVPQLAVARDQRGRGLGRALLLEALGRQVAGGATRLGLGVSATNSDALQLYLSIGLEIDREWLSYRPAR